MADAEQVKLAKKVIETAKKHNIYEGPIPDDGDKSISEAAQIVEQARDAFEAGVKGEPVMAVLQAAGVVDGSGDKAPASTAPTDATPAPAREVAEPWDSFDSDKPKDVLERFKSGEFTREQVAGFIEYEKENNERGKIVNFDLDEVPAGDPPAEPPDESDVNYLIPDYDNLGVKEVIATFESGKLTPDQIRAVQAYEAGDEGAERGKILKFDADSVTTDAEPSEDPAAAAPVAGDRTVNDIIDDYGKRRSSTVLKEVAKLDTGDLRILLAYEQSDEGKQREVVIDAIKEKLLEKGELVNSPPQQTDGDKELDKQLDDAVARDDERDDRAPIAPARNAQLDEVEHRERVLAELKKAGFEQPEVEGDDFPQIPREVSELSDDVLNQLMLDFNAWFALASYKLALATVDEEHFRRVANHHARVILVDLPKINKDTERPKTEQILEAEVEQHEKVAPWREAQALAHENVVLYRAQKELLKGGYDALSRILTYRLDERERAGNRR